ncbi:MAG: ATP-binding protein [Bacteroidales bacterium]|jgi:predicted AAA+ superfamily ATPase|nr:ATP-binding protein [Bacteroidales bacterium]
MEINRDILQDLKLWKNNPHRKPLILQGAKQVGKSFVLKKFGEQCFKKCVLIDFDLEPEHKTEFAKTKNPHRLISYISAVKGIKINPKDTLLIFDEIQECNDALNSLKYFCEQMPEQAVVCAGSLLGVALKREGTSFPVGKVDFMTLYPVSFKEFLALYNKQLSQLLEQQVEILKKKVDLVPEIIHNQLIEAYKIYLCCGGMPETVGVYLETSNWNDIDKISNQILTAYTLDFSKHINNKDIPRVHKLWNTIHDNLGKEDRKFKYAMIEKSARARDYEDAVEWLTLTGLVHRVFEVQTLRLPLSSCKNAAAFKLYLSDVGLLRTKFRLDPQTIINGDRLFIEFKGILTENYVLQSIVRQLGRDIFYWVSGNTAEIEFVVQQSQKIVPIEVKSALSVKPKSLSEYRKKHLPKLSVRLSLKNVTKNDDLLNLPLYLVDYLSQLLGCRGLSAVGVGKKQGQRI